eukprot:scaffold7198_cov150-Skeletonema_menzelii.AAC.6
MTTTGHQILRVKGANFLVSKREAPPESRSVSGSVGSHEYLTHTEDTEGENLSVCFTRDDVASVSFEYNAASKNLSREVSARLESSQLCR